MTRSSSTPRGLRQHSTTSSLRASLIIASVVGCFGCGDGSLDASDERRVESITEPLAVRTPGVITDVDAHDLIGFVAREASAGDPPTLDVLNLGPTQAPWTVGRLALAERPYRIRAVGAYVYALVGSSISTNRLIVVDV